MSNNLSDMEESTLEYINSLTLLCVEDNKTTQLMYESIFEDQVKEIIYADNGADGYQKYLEKDVDIIISDFDMPILNGLEMSEKIREKDKEIPIILVTSIEDATVIVKALQLNVNNFIRKPIKPNEVLDAVVNASKVLIANKYLEEQKKQKVTRVGSKR